HPIPGLILQHRELTKLKTTYLEPLPTFINPNTGRVHTSFSQTLVVTGRLSSSDPNLQNIPASEGFGMQIREAFYAPRGSVLLSADYAQVELRILAHLSKDPTLMRVFLEGHDIHAETAAQLFDVPVDKVTHDQRQLGKRINFSIIYGVTPYGLAKDLGIKQGEAKAYIEKYFQRFPKVASWIEKTIERATADGYVETFMGRRRYIPELAERNRTLQEAGKRMATNTPVQGTQAEIMKIAMINIDQRFKKEGLAARMILQIHDELVVEVPNDELPAVEKIVQTEMGSVVQWEVPLKVTRQKRPKCL
ncbi:DNA polymerase I, partial [bacterium]|nr:DNA polymerase I [bacterium]